MTPEEVATHGKLDKSLKEGNPKEKATQLRLRASRISRLAQSVTQKLAIVDDVAVAKLRRQLSPARGGRLGAAALRPQESR